jgi:methionyl-tRNA formyltransferase
MTACPACSIHCDDLHTPSSIARLRELAPDLGIVFATYPLRPELFTIPRLGCLNLHLGRAPEFRGSSPGFYEMLEGVPEVGVTIHRVSEGLDAGPILLQEVFPLDLAPQEDPISYLQQYQAEILIPNGIRLMARAVERMAQGTAEERSQPAGHRPRRRASHRLKQELRRLVAARRSGGAAAQLLSPTVPRN